MAGSTGKPKREPDMRAEDKDPGGGLSASGRKKLKSSGRKVKKGVTKPEKDMTSDELRRKGQFLKRHYGKKDIPPLVDEKGEPTRYSLQAQAWGESIPKTLSDVEKLAKKGDALLTKYRNSQINRGIRKALNG